MGKTTLFEQYQEALEEFKEELREKRREALREEIDTGLFDQLSERIEAEDLQLMLNCRTGLYYVATMAGDAISEEMNLDEIEDWLEDPRFILPDQLDIEDLEGGAE